MAYWTGEKIVHSKPIPVENYPGWEHVDCGCCNGLQWGGEEPRECDDCKGSGSYVRHIKSGAMAFYPGGPFIGRE